MKTGKIVIKDKVYFEYYELEKPENKDHSAYAAEDLLSLLAQFYKEAMKKYEASKQLIEVSNVKQISRLYFFYFGSKIIMHPNYELKDGTKVKAEITGDKATIVELN